MKRYKSLYGEHNFKKDFNTLLLENKAINYLKQMSSLIKQAGMQKDFYKWQAKVAKNVKCMSYKDIPEIKQEVEAFLKSHSVKQKECYYNAYRCSDMISGIEYVEGIADLIIPMSHAWNCYKGKHFDLTAEVVLKEDVTTIAYAQIIKLKMNQVYKYARKSGLAGEYIVPFYRDKIHKGK